jgi:hypothetical protein
MQTCRRSPLGVEGTNSPARRWYFMITAVEHRDERNAKAAPGEKSPIDAFREGLNARAHGRDRRSNPYVDCSVEHFLWESGWRDRDHAPGEGPDSEN